MKKPKKPLSFMEALIDLELKIKIQLALQAQQNEELIRQAEKVVEPIFKGEGKA